MNGPSHPQPRRCCRVVFEGRVQGVGFRYTAAAAARAYHVNGYVRNRADGTVELLAEGPAQSVDRLLESLVQTFAGNIEHQTVEEVTQSDPVPGFEIRR